MVAAGIALAIGGCLASDEERVKSVFEERLAASADDDHRRYVR